MNDTSEHIAKTYRALRVLLFVIGLSLPVVLMIGGKWSAGIPLGTHSMSAYYHLSAAPLRDANNNFRFDEIETPANLGVMRNWLVGGLFSAGILLIAYKGIRPLENWIFNLAGIMAWGVALFPMGWPIKPSDGRFSVAHLFSSLSMHGLCAFILFFCFFYICIFRARDTVTEQLIPDSDRRKWYKRAYMALGCMMGLSPFFAWGFTLGSANHVTFYVESFGVWVFAIYWGVKTREMAESKFDEKVMRGEIEVPDVSSKTVFAQVPVK